MTYDQYFEAFSRNEYYGMGIHFDRRYSGPVADLFVLCTIIPREVLGRHSH